MLLAILAILIFWISAQLLLAPIAGRFIRWGLSDDDLPDGTVTLNNYQRKPKRL